MLTCREASPGYATASGKYDGSTVILSFFGWRAAENKSKQARD
jgi:hypothetical protein